MTILLAALPLPALVWLDEFAAQSVMQTRRRTLDGGQVVFYAGLAAGRGITLESREDAGWLRRDTVEVLARLADSPGGVYPLVLRGQTFNVLFRHDDPPAFEARPLWPLADPQAGDYYLATLKLVTV